MDIYIEVWQEETGIVKDQNTYPVVLYSNDIVMIRMRRPSPSPASPLPFLLLPPLPLPLPLLLPLLLYFPFSLPLLTSYSSPIESEDILDL